MEAPEREGAGASRGLQRRPGAFANHRRQGPLGAAADVTAGAPPAAGMD